MTSKDEIKKGLEAVDKLFDEMSPEEFERQYESLQNKDCGESIESFLERSKTRKEGLAPAVIDPNNELLKAP